MKPKWIKETDECQYCHTEMPLIEYFLRKDETAVEAWYVCEQCGKFGFALTGNFVKAFKEHQKNERTKIKTAQPKGNESEESCG